MLEEEKKRKKRKTAVQKGDKTGNRPIWRDDGDEENNETKPSARERKINKIQKKGWEERKEKSCVAEENNRKNKSDKRVWSVLGREPSHTRIPRERKEEKNGTARKQAGAKKEKCRKRKQ